MASEFSGTPPPPVAAASIVSATTVGVLLPPSASATASATAPVETARGKNARGEREVSEAEVAADALVRVTQEDVRQSESKVVTEDEVVMSECETLVRECCCLHPAHRAADHMTMAAFRILEPALTQSHRIESLRVVVARLQHVLDGSPSADGKDAAGSTAVADGDGDSSDRLDNDERGVWRRRLRRAEPPVLVDAKLARHVVRLFRKRGVLLHRVFVRAVRVKSVPATASAEDDEIDDHRRRRMAKTGAWRNSMGDDDDDDVDHGRFRTPSFDLSLSATIAARRRYQPQATIEHDDTRPLFVAVVTRAKIRVAIVCATVLLAAILFGTTLS